jgi:threonine dehydrogenase-like Zn-dependent dehydrogenase
MRALRYHGPKKPLRLEEVPTPDPRPGEVLVRVTAVGICHTELHFLSGLLDLGVAPLTLGHEIVGRIEQVGAGVPAQRVGERAIVYYYVGCGDARCRAGRTLRRARQYGFSPTAALADPRAGLAPSSPARRDAKRRRRPAVTPRSPPPSRVALGDWVVVSERRSGLAQ